MLLTFVITALVLTLIPGPDAALIMRTSIAHGRSAGFRTMLGGVLGLTVHATAATVGLSALLAASPPVFLTLRWLGIAYLVWLGFQGLRSRGKGEAEEAGQAGGSRIGQVRNGFLSNLLNPKVLLFFVTFLPQFMGSIPVTVLSVIFVAMYVIWFSIYTLIVDRLGTLLRTPVWRRRVERATGVVLIGFALRLAIQ